MDRWCFANGLPAEEPFTLIHWQLRLTGYYLLLCDVFRSLPENPLLFFMQKVVASAKGDAVDCPALAFIHGYIQEIYAIKNN
ncbi:MAG: hypothetical protein EOO14_12770 [Chitinophagaceae bacterium]|nr:MAG: hypothetical protein EOO14_12770 [Chitinophagaceae bacterium]